MADPSSSPVPEGDSAADPEPSDDPDPGPQRLVGPLPEPVRQRVVALAADALAAMAPEEVPGSLKPFRRFTPGRRARLAGTPLAAALEHDESFRMRVSSRVREALPDLAAALEHGRTPPAADPLDVAAVAYVVRPSGWEDFVLAAQDELRRAEEAAATAGGSSAAAHLEEQLAVVRNQARTEVERLRQELTGVKAENVRLRHTLHDVRIARRAAEAEATAARAEAELATSRAASEAAAAEAELRRARARAAEAQAGLESSRRAAREGRSIADVRLRLLLDTVVEATQGLRRELALPPSAPDAARPADLVGAQVPETSGVADVSGQARAADDPALLDELLALPQVHLVVDGYNVTKLGYGSLPLQKQRERLVSGLAGIAAASGAEVTVCFDGAEVQTPVAMPTPRRVRVLFSVPGETADELIRRLVGAEPPGRPVVVVSTDKEVADGVRARGARAVPATALLRRLART